MPINPINFPTISWEGANPFFSGMQQSAQTGNLFADMISKALQQQRMRELLPLQLQGLQLGNEKASAELPYVGDLAKASAQYKTAMANYLSSPNQQLRGLSAVGKSYIEPGVVSQIQGFNSPAMQQNGENRNDLSDIYGLYRQKTTSDPSTRNRDLFATNIEKTMDFINPDDLAKYSGISGKLKKVQEQAKSALGDSSQEYQDYVKSINAAKFLAKQVRQFLGASITPQMDQQLQVIANPESWSNDPKIVKQLFSQFKNILGNELTTYRDALKSTAPYEGKSNKSKDIQGRVEATKTLNDRSYVKINGQWYEK